MKLKPYDCLLSAVVPAAFKSRTTGNGLALVRLVRGPEGIPSVGADRNDSAADIPIEGHEIEIVVASELEVGAVLQLAP